MFLSTVVVVVVYISMYAVDDFKGVVWAEKPWTTTYFQTLNKHVVTTKPSLVQDLFYLKANWWCRIMSSLEPLKDVTNIACSTYDMTVSKCFFEKLSFALKLLSPPQHIFTKVNTHRPACDMWRQWTQCTNDVVVFTSSTYMYIFFIILAINVYTFITLTSVYVAAF